MEQTQGAIVGYVRTPFEKASPPRSGKPPGHFADIDPVDLAVPLLNTLLERTNLDPAHIQKILNGTVHQEGSQGLNLARLFVLHEKCNLPQSVGGTSVDRFCGSSMEAIAIADAFLARNPEHVYFCTGAQSMSQIPMGGMNPHLNPYVHDGNVAGFVDMLATTENLMKIYNISREEQDTFAVRSHQRMANAQRNGHFKNEIVSIKGLDHDDGVRPDTSLEKLAKLKPLQSAESGGTVTAGTSSQITDGASAIMLTSRLMATRHNLPVLAHITSFGESGCAPEIMGIGPVEAIKDAFNKAGLSMGDMDYIELNEAFAAQSLAVLKELESQGMAIPEERLNVDGGAIAMGHPLGASGARLVGHVAETLRRENGRYGLATMCIGGGQGVAMVVENPAYKPGL